MATAHPRLAGWKERFAKAPLARKIVADLEGRRQDIWRRTFELLQEESPEYRNAVDDEFTAESRSHCGDLLHTITAIAAGRLDSRDPFAFVRKHAEWRARHQVPLVASLHAYRLAHKTYWGITREALAGHRRRKEALHALTTLSDFWIELFEAVGAALEEAHAAEEARIVAQNTRAYTALMDDLLSGTEPARPDGRRLLTLCGIRPGTAMTVAAIRPFSAENGAPVDVEVTLRSLVRLLQQALPSSVFGKLVGLRNGEIVAIVSSDGDASGRLLKHLGRQRFAGRAGDSAGAGAGVGLDKIDFAGLPEALAEARMALELTSPTRALLHFGGIDLGEFVIRRAGKPALRLIPDWVREAGGNGQEDDLIRTIRAFAESSLNVKQTARRLGVHTNTVYFRLNQIKKRAGVDPRTFSGTSFLVTALRLLETHGEGNGGTHRSAVTPVPRGPSDR
jgi:hypothetical protein